MIFSTDPAHSLADSLDVPVGEEIRSVGDVPNLFVQEVDAVRRWEGIKKEYQEAIEEVFDRFVGDDPTMRVRYDKEVLSSLVSMIPPGVDELMALKVPCEDIVVNMLLPAGLKCSFCSGRYSQQQAYLYKIRKSLHAYYLREVGQLTRPVRGMTVLKELVK